MQYSNLNLFVKYNDIIIPKTPVNDKYICLMTLSENDNTINTLNSTSFAGKTIKQVVVPNSYAPYRTYMSAEYKTELQKNGYIPYKTNINELNKINGKHFIIDTSKYIFEVTEKLNIHIFNNNKFRTLFDSYFNDIVSHVNPLYDKVLLYSLNLDLPFTDKLLNRKILPLYITMIKNIQNFQSVIPFNKIIFYAYSNKNDINDYYLVFDKSKKVNPNKMKDILTQYENVLKNNNNNDMEEFVGSDDNFDEDEVRHAMTFKEDTSLKKKINVPPKYPVSIINPNQQPVQFLNPQQPTGMSMNTGNPILTTHPSLVSQRPISVVPPSNIQMNPVQPIPNSISQTPYTQSNVYTGDLQAAPAPTGAAPPPSMIQKGVSAVTNAVKNTTANQRAATAGILALGAGAVALKMKQNEKREEWYASNCEKLTGWQKSRCTSYVNNIKLTNLNQLLKFCNNEPNCIKEVQNDIEKLKKDMNKGIVSK